MNKTNTMNVLTHAGNFHADDIFATALLRLYAKKEGISLNVTRVLSMPEHWEDNYDFAYDIGGGIYDHHQPDAEIRENGIPYAAFGLLWRKYGPELVGQKDTEHFDRVFVQQMDQSDNTGDFNTLCFMMKGFNPGWNETKSSEDSFSFAVDMAEAMLATQIRRMQSKDEADELVNEAYAKSDDPQIVILDRFAPWQSVLAELKDPLFVIYPSNRGGYNVETVPVSKTDRHPRMPLPEAWLIDPPKGCHFVHNSLFLAAFDTLSNAIMAANMFLQTQ